MASSNLVRLGAPGALLAGVAWIATGILDLLIMNFSTLEEGLFVVALLGTLGGLVGFHARQVRRYGWFGTTGFLAAFVGSALLLIGLVISLLVRGGGVELPFPGLIGLIIVITFIGYVILGIATVREDMLPQWSGILLIVCLPLALALGNYGGGIVLGLIWLGLGYVLLSRRDLSSLL